MSHAAIVGTAWVIALAWVVRLLQVALGLRKVPNLLVARFDSFILEEETVAVIVPARNEERRVTECLESLIRQDFGRLHIVAIDDRSEDRTGEIMDRLAGETDRLDVLHIRELPPGWLGKTHAMVAGATHAVAKHNPKWLLFTDGDILFRADAIRRAMAGAAESQADHFVTLPTMLIESRGEAMVLSFIQAMSLWAIRTWRVADPKARDAVGVGAFNMIRTSAYREIGGFEAIRMEVLEDLTLGRRVKAAGLRQRVAVGPGMLCVHWAPGIRGIVRGMTKNVFAVFGFRITRLVAAAVWIAVFAVAPVFLMAVRDARVPVVIWAGAVAGFYVVSGRLTRISPIYVLLCPAAAIVTIYAMLRSAIVTLFRGGVTWRGTFYPLVQLRTRSRAGRA